MSLVRLWSVAPSQGRLTVAPPSTRRDDDALDHVDGNGEADPHAAAGTRIDRRIDADQLAVEIDQRAAGIAGIDGGVGLDEEAVVADSDLRARKRGNYALSDRLADGERVADGDDKVTDFERVRIAKLEHREIPAALEPEHREIRSRIAQHNLRLELALVGKRDFHLGHALDHVVVGDDETRGVDDHAGAQRLLHPLVLASLAAEETAEDRIVEQRIARHGLDAGGVDVHHRRRRLLYHRREREPHLRRALRRGPLDCIGEGGSAEKGGDDGERQANQTGPPAFVMRPLI